jgi:hypothetical protein
MSKPLFGVVEIGNDPMLLLIAGVFVVTFITVCAAAYVLLAKRRTDGPATTWKFELQSRLPVSNHTFERIAAGTAAAMARPRISEARRAQLNQLERARGVFVSVYRVLFISVGLAGLIAGILLLRSHTPANMLGLYGAIVVLFALGALLNGIVPGPSVVPMEPLSRVHLDQLKQKIKVQVFTSEPLTVTLSAAEIRAAREMLRRGVPIADAVGAVYPGYEGLVESDKRALECVLRQATGEP